MRPAKRTGGADEVDTRPLQFASLSESEIRFNFDWAPLERAIAQMLDDLIDLLVEELARVFSARLDGVEYMTWESFSASWSGVRLADQGAPAAGTLPTAITYAPDVQQSDALIADPCIPHSFTIPPLGKWAGRIDLAPQGIVAPVADLDLSADWLRLKPGYFTPPGQTTFPVGYTFDPDRLSDLLRLMDGTRAALRRTPMVGPGALVHCPDFRGLGSARVAVSSRYGEPDDHVRLILRSMPVICGELVLAC